MKTVFICEDHTLYRQGEIDLVSQYPEEFEIVGTATNGTSALKEITALNPDIILLDLNLPGINGLDILGQIRRTNTTIVIIVLTSYNDQTLIKKVRLARGNAYLLKDGDSSELIEVMRKVAPNGFHLQNSLSKERESLSPSDQFVAVASLTARECDLVQQLAAGASTAQAADQLSISENTVRNHRKNLYRKLNVSTVQELIIFCQTHGLLHQ